MKKIAVLVLCFLLVLNGAHVEARPHRRRPNYKLFVFGDSFVDIGNRGPTSQRIEISRQWYTPYGMSDPAHGNRATGRFSDGLVQSDFVAKILGRDESPPAVRLWHDDGREFTGLNFAVGGSSVYEEADAPCLRNQTEQLRSMVRNRYIDEEDLEDSVALVAVTGMRDYIGLTGVDTDDDLARFANSVTDKILDAVRRLQRMGVSKVLVDTMPALGCTPWRSWSTRYTRCDSRGNRLSDLHNTALRQKLGELDDVLLLDLNTIFNSIMSGSASSQQFHRTLAPCCEAWNPDSYCGLVDDRGTKQYNLCPDPANFFYWDFWHPTQAAWTAVMQVLEEPIKDFLGI
ncbi:hypothetical protein EJB05_29940 [Eragrostis curvula]|uniref:GDSL esterase/lipase n=1 Tax=Eragrostis curvula TaxID=38414 RepID=A0A5J9UVI3_9POAL|nr:hypothetical protein EJB05_29934 [Eragrostis curvula]TVU27337.1 hypothetical protein EJB05_29940 [Eragrostis curvula]